MYKEKKNKIMSPLNCNQPNLYHAKSLTKMQLSAKLYNEQYPKHSINNLYPSFFITTKNQQYQTFKQQKIKYQKLKSPVLDGLCSSQFKEIQSQEQPFINKKLILSMDIEGHLRSQNKNLIQHRDFLLQQVRKFQSQIKNYKKIITQFQKKTKKLYDENKLIHHQYQQLKQCIKQFKNNMKICDISVSKQLNIMSIQQKQNKYEGRIQVHKIHSMKQSKKIQNNMMLQLDNQKIKTHQRHKTNKTKISQTQTLQLVINQLNDRFDIMMQQQKNSKDPYIRKKCLQIAKQIRNLKQRSQRIYKLKDHYQQKLQYNSNQLINQPKCNLIESIKNPLNNSLITSQLSHHHCQDEYSIKFRDISTNYTDR